MPKCSNYISDVKLRVEIVHPRSESLFAGVINFASNNDIYAYTDYDVYHQRLHHRKRPRNEKLDNIKLTVSYDTFKQPASTNAKLIGVLQNILKCLDPDLKFDLELIGFISEALHDISYHCSEMGVTSYYASLQRKRVHTLFNKHNQSENIYLNIYYDYSQEENNND